MSRTLNPLALLLLPLALAACAPEPGTPIALGELCRAANDGQQVAVEGYVGAGVTIFCSNTGGGPVTCGLDLAESPGGPAVASLYVPQGGGHSEIEEVPDSWTPEALRVHAEDGSLVAITGAAPDRVRITGRASVVEGEGAVCFVTADLIEKVAAAPAG